MTIHIRTMTENDLPLGMRLKSQAGWNQTPAEWRRFLAMEPEGCLVAELEGVPVGTAVVTAFERVAWVSMVLVDQQFRGRGVGKALMNHVVELAEEFGCKTIRLDATPLGQPLYESLGFVPQYALTRYAGIAESAVATVLSVPQVLRIARSEDMPAILAVDSIATGTRRGKFLFLLFAGDSAPFRVVEQPTGRINGYFTARTGSDAAQLGPCIAQTDEIGTALLTDAFSRHAGCRVYWDFPSSHVAAAQLATFAGLVPQRQLLRMCRGEGVNDDVSKLWASSGPELG